MRKILLLLFVIFIYNTSFAFGQSNRDGLSKAYYQNGKLKSSETFKNGRKVGVCKYYYDNGQVQYEENYNNEGQAEGVFNAYYKNGQLESIFSYRNGQKHGIYKEYYEDGRLRDEGRYEHGSPYKPNQSSQNNIQSNDRNNNGNTQADAYYVFGTSKELKESGLLNGSINKNHLIKINSQKTNKIDVYSKVAIILSKHPSGSYELKKNNNGNISVYVINPNSFWSLTKILIVQVQ